MRNVEGLEALLAAGTDNALLRYSLGCACLEAGRTARAVEHLAVALDQDPGYSAAWKAYGRALAGNGDEEAAIEAYRRGIENAEAKGDLQAAREMRVFRRRLEKARRPPEGGAPPAP